MGVPSTSSAGKVGHRWGDGCRMVALRKGHLTGEMAKEGNPHPGLKVLEVLLGSRRLGKRWWRLES